MIGNAFRHNRLPTSSPNSENRMLKPLWRIYVSHVYHSGRLLDVGADFSTDNVQRELEAAVTAVRAHLERTASCLRMPASRKQSPSKLASTLGRGGSNLHRLEKAIYVTHVYDGNAFRRKPPNFRKQNARVAASHIRESRISRLSFD